MLNNRNFCERVSLATMFVFKGGGTEKKKENITSEILMNELVKTSGSRSWFLRCFRLDITHSLLNLKKEKSTT